MPLIGGDVGDTCRSHEDQEFHFGQILFAGPVGHGSGDSPKAVTDRYMSSEFRRESGLGKDTWEPSA